jgi:maleate isomerase
LLPTKVRFFGIVGDIKPRATDSSLVDMIKLLPEGIGVIPVHLYLTGSREEYGSSYAIYEKHIAYLASQKCNVIAIEGARTNDHAVIRSGVEAAPPNLV